MISASGIASACGGKTATAAEPADVAADSIAAIAASAFDADSAYSYIERQLSFGNRVPGSDGHRECRQWLVERLKSYGADTVIQQHATVTAATGDRLPVCNILARFNTASPTPRLLIAAHYDTRPWADNDPDESRRHDPIPGANDGGSGVAVALEIARHAYKAAAVDILLVDAEDYGISDSDDEDTWCLGTQYWIEHQPFTMTDKPIYGILLDMVGGTDAVFRREYFSESSARYVTDMVWREAAIQGLSGRFIPESGGAVTDDHIYLSRGGIPTTDIIECTNASTGSFNPRWHTHADDIEGIDRATLKAVGQVVFGVALRHHAISQ
ncbi:MAG: M28 family peptidase [Muribaculaceae bacterium]